MGLAERFKNKLENRNIFEKNVIEQKLEENDIKFISKPVEDKIKQKNTSIKSPIVIPSEYNILAGNNDEIHENRESCENISMPEPEIEIQNIKENLKNKFENLETELINKIRKTPYWEEFSFQSQTNMIENYFNVKIKSSKYNTLEYTNEDKQNFINTVLTLSNNR